MHPPANNKLDVVKNSPLAPAWMDGALEEAFKRVAKLKRAQESADKYTRYQQDPVGFCRDVLGDVFTPEIEKVLESVRDNQVTEAQSSNGIGKSHSAARIAIWFYMVWAESKVYVTAAPPDRNMIDNIWAHIAYINFKKPALFSGHTVKRLKISRHEESFLEGVTIPTQGSKEQREAKFCADADDLYELPNGRVVTYGDMIGKYENAVSVAPDFSRKTSTAQFFDNGVEDVYEITLESGHKIRRTGKHPLYAGNLAPDFKTYGGDHVKGRYRVSKERWVPVDSLRPGNVVLTPDDTSFNFGWNHLDPNVVKVMAYLIGDGCITSPQKILFMQEDNRQLAEFKDSVAALGSRVVPFKLEEYAWKVVGDGSGRTGSNPVITLLKSHVLTGKDSSDKFVPDAINTATRETVVLFLNRLFSTDGYACVCKAGKYKKAEIGYVSKSERLVRDLQRLLFRFGVHAKVSSTRKSWIYKGIKKTDRYWACTISRAGDVIRFAERIGIFGKEDAVNKCAEYSRSRQANAVWRSHRVDGYRWEKIRSIELIGPKPTVGVCVPGDETYLTNLVEHNSGKHAPALLFIVDEADAVPEEVFKGIESCMSSEFIRLLILFNPRSPQGVIYEKAKSGRAKVIEITAFSHPNVVKGYDIIPGAVSRDVTVRRIHEWTRPLAFDEKPDDKCFEVPSYLVGVSATAPDGSKYPPLQPGFRKVEVSEFWYMVLGKYPPQGSRQVFAQEWIDAAIARRKTYVAMHGEVPPPGINPVIGIDCAEYGGDSNTCVARYGGWVGQVRRWGGLDADENSDYAWKLYKEYHAASAMVDALGVGASVAPKMSRLARSDDYRGQDGGRAVIFGVKVSEKPSKMTQCDLGEFFSLRDECMWRLREWLRLDPTAMLPDDQLLKEDLLAMTYEYMEGNGKIKMVKKEKLRDILKRSPDSADGLALTFAPLERAKVRTAQ